MSYPNLYEINTRVWLRRFDTKINKAKLSDVSLSYWEKLSRFGIDYVWLMGIWEICESSIPKYCMGESSIAEYKSALNDFETEDVIGSPFAINNYEINPIVGSKDDLLELRKNLNELNIKLILDFIPNHFSAESHLIKSNPDLFIHAAKEQFDNDKDSFFKDSFGRDIYFAHGRDPFFPAWTDTVQVNYMNEATVNFMSDKLVEISDLCDGVRCDMAMLILNDVFNKTWGKFVLPKDDKSNDEFWKTAIEKVKQHSSNFIFIAEAYWDLERKLQQIGFDFTYDKKLSDQLITGNVQLIRQHLKEDETYQNKSVRFIENHDEKRAVVSLGDEKSRAAAVLISCLPGMRFFHDGQFEGRKIKLPVQLGREPVEDINLALYDFYKKLLNITQDKVFKEGKWEVIDPAAAGSDDSTHENIMAIHWSLKSEKRLLVVNYSNEVSFCRIKLDVENYVDNIMLIDLLEDKKFNRLKSEIISQGLFIKLGSYQSHIFKY
ncbi:alpha-amylase family glycosyl hydrolase [Bacteroidota bacterium]